MSLPVVLIDLCAKAGVFPTLDGYLRAIADGAVKHGLAFVWAELDKGATFRVLHGSDSYPPFEDLRRMIGRPLDGTMGFLGDDTSAMAAMRTHSPMFVPDLFDRALRFASNLPGASMPALERLHESTFANRGYVLPLNVDGRPWGFVMLLGETLTAEDSGVLSSFATWLESAISLRIRLERSAVRTAAPPQVVSTAADVRHSGMLLKTLVEQRRVSSVLDVLTATLLETLGADVVSIYLLADTHLVLSAQRCTPEVPEEFGNLDLAQRELNDETLIGLVAIEGRMIGGRAEQMPPKTASWAVRAGFSQCIAVPIKVGGRLLGVMGAVRIADVPFEWNAQELIELGGFAARSAEIAEEELRREWDLRLINELGRLVSSSLDASEILRACVRYLARAVDVPNVFILTRDEVDRERLNLVATNVSDVALESVSVRLTDTAPSSHAVLTGEPVVVNDVHSSQFAMHPAIRRFGHTAIAALPILAEREAVGVVILGETRGPRVFSRTEIERGRAMSNQLGAALRNAELFANLRKSYETLATAQAQLVAAERLAAIGELSAIMAHEVRNPLASIFNSLATLRRLVQAPSDAVMMMDILQEEAGRLNRIVDALLDYVRPFAPSYRPVDPVELARSVIAGFENTQSPKTAAPVALEFDKSLCSVESDEHLIRQALINLLENASQAVVGADASVVLHVRHNGSLTGFEVRDNGPGIPADVHSRVFQPFFTTKPMGTGLGLPIVKRIANALGGTVDVESLPGKGTCVTLWIPDVPKEAHDTM